MSSSFMQLHNMQDMFHRDKAGTSMKVWKFRILYMRDHKCPEHENLKRRIININSIIILLFLFIDLKIFSRYIYLHFIGGTVDEFRENGIFANHGLSAHVRIS